jgi:hypothetical protein
MTAVQVGYRLGGILSAVGVAGQGTVPAWVARGTVMMLKVGLRRAVTSCGVI